jgi:hypothetical protein
MFILYKDICRYLYEVACLLFFVPKKKVKAAKGKGIIIGKEEKGKQKQTASSHEERNMYVCTYVHILVVDAHREKQHIMYTCICMAVCT